jgi:hypothetical protein
MVVSEDMTDVLAEETLDAFPKFLNAVDIFLIEGEISVRSWSERCDSLVHFIVPGYVGYQVFNEREGFDWLNGYFFAFGKSVHSGLAHKTWFAVYFSAA